MKRIEIGLKRCVQATAPLNPESHYEQYPANRVRRESALGFWYKP
jgi:hypothetical protein